MRLGILEMVGTVGTLIFALPVAGYGVERAIGGDLLFGAGFVGLAALMVLLPRKLTTPSDVPAEAAERAVGGVVGDDED
ncbi:hypothetical protein [Halobaculum sp. MBLA0143]|uniref:DUF7533 family protein n=1 Tax=Halobaculum sp. MBLA0143 TaxID=3079933 RepID=UPI003526B0A5